MKRDYIELHKIIAQLCSEELIHAVFNGEFQSDIYGNGVLGHKNKHIQRIAERVTNIIQAQDEGRR